MVVLMLAILGVSTGIGYAFEETFIGMIIGIIIDLASMGIDGLDLLDLT